MREIEAIKGKKKWVVREINKVRNQKPLVLRFGVFQKEERGVSLAILLTISFPLVL